MRDPAPSLTRQHAGFGLGLRTPHYQDFLRERQPLDWLEIISDNYLVDGGKPLRVLDRLRQDYPIAMHGVAMSLGASTGVDLQYLRRLKALADRVEPLWVSDHLCWIGHGSHQLHDLYPLPYTDEAAHHVVTQIRRAQEVLQRRLVIENVSSYLIFPHAATSEHQFLAYVAAEADCLLLVDVNNVHVSSVNHGFDAIDYLRALPAQRVQQIHLAGHSIRDDHLIDTHDHPVSEAVWALYAEARALFGPVATMIERDADIPPLADLLHELSYAREVTQEVDQARLGKEPAVGRQGGDPTWTPTVESARPGPSPTLAELQAQLAANVLSADDPLSPAATLAARARYAYPQAEVRVAIYHNAYRSRLAEVLADTYTRTSSYLGAEFDHQARDYAVKNPPTARSLSRYGATFPDHLAARFPANPELRELAQLDWDLRSRFDGPDWPALDAPAAQADTASTWLQRPSPLHPSLLLRTVTTNVVQLWKALDTDDEVPVVDPLPAPLTLMTWRKDLQPQFQTLDAEQAQFIDELARGASIAEACATLADGPALRDPTQLGRWLRQWLDEGLLAG